VGSFQGADREQGWPQGADGEVYRSRVVFTRLYSSSIVAPGQSPEAEISTSDPPSSWHPLKERSHYTLNWRSMLARGIAVVGPTVQLELDVQAMYRSPDMPTPPE